MDIQIKRESSAHSNGVACAGRCAHSKSTRRGIGGVARGDRCVEDWSTIVERGGAGGIGGCSWRARADGEDSSKCYTREGEGDDDGLKHCELVILFVCLASGGYTEREKNSVFFGWSIGVGVDRVERDVFWV